MKGQTPEIEPLEEEIDNSYEEFMQRPTTLPENLTITLAYFADEQDAHKCADAVRGYLQVFGRLMDLSFLDRVYVSFDYEATLASIDRGTSSGSILTPTKDDVAVGIAMAPTVKRDDGWKSLIVLNAQYARTLYHVQENATAEEEKQLTAIRAEMVHTLAHECGHVHDHAMQAQSLPEDTYSKVWTPIEHRLKEPAMACWSEYIAEYLSAGFGTEDTFKNYETGFTDRLTSAWPTITKAIRQYRMHGDIDRVIAEVGTQIRHVLIYAGYLLGYMAKMGLQMETAAAKAAQAITEHAELGGFIARLDQELGVLHGQYPEFASLEVFTPMSEVIHDMYKEAGLTFTANEEGRLHVAIPHRANTTPSFQDRAEFLLSQIHKANS